MFDNTFQSYEFLVDSTFIFNNPYCYNFDYNLYLFSFIFLSKTFKLISAITFTSLFLYNINNYILFDLTNLYINNHIFMVFDFKHTSLSYLFFLLWKFDYFFHYYYIIYYIYIVLLLIYIVFFSILFKYLIQFYFYFYNFFLYILYTFKLNDFLRDAFNINFFKSLSMLYSYYYTSWILYLEWEYKLIFDREIKQKLIVPILHFVIIYLSSGKYVNVWTDSMDLWRFLLRLFYKLFYLPFYTFYVFIVRLLIYYVDYFGLLKYVYVSFSLFYWKFLQNLNLLKSNFIYTLAFQTLNKIAYLMFFDFHYSSMYFIYSFLPKKFHIHDPAIFGVSYPAIIHPWVKKLIITVRFEHYYKIRFYDNINYILQILIYILQYIQILFISTIQYTFKLLFYALKWNYGFIYIIIFQKIRNFLLYLILLFPYKFNIYLFLLIIMYLLFSSSLFCLVFLFGIYFIICILKEKLISYLYIMFNLFLILIGYIICLPFYCLLYIVRIFVFISVFILTSFFSIFVILLFFFVFLKYDTVFIFEFLWYIFKSIAFDWIFDYLNYYVLGALFEFHFNWKTFLINNIELTTYYLKIASRKYNYRLKYYHYNDMFFNSLGLLKYNAFKLWFNNMDLFNRRINIYYHVRFYYLFYSLYFYLIKGPQAITFYFTQGNLFIFYFYFNKIINYLIYNLFLHIGLINSLYFKYFLVLRYIDYLPKWFYFYIGPLIFWFKSFFYLNLFITWFWNNLVIFYFYLWSCIYIISLYLLNFNIYSFLYIKFLIFYNIFFNIYYFFFDLLFFFNYKSLNNANLLLDFIRRAYLYAVLSYDYFYDFLYSYLRLSRIGLNKFINFRELYITRPNWKIK